ncbi:hypothetical protein ACFQH3_12055 [Haladaptatus sp. GCM10025707]|uniref:hypothetical protein n=1 Tax=Haladaptatus sp. GCM10025707 TaxID=3252658 RepID=UPI0026E55DA3|nr:hypothetical protein [Haladaptatus sp. QDMS2]
MATEHTAVSFDEHDTRTDEMHRTIESWLAALQDLTDEAQASAEFKAWLTIQSKFHEYSVNNTLLIKQQWPTATKVTGYRTWQDGFDRHVSEVPQLLASYYCVVQDCCHARLSRGPTKTVKSLSR